MRRSYLMTTALYWCSSVLTASRRRRAARFSWRIQGAGVQRLPRFRRQQPRQHRAGPRRHGAQLLQKGHQRLCRGKTPVSRNGTLLEVCFAIWSRRHRRLLRRPKKPPPARVKADAKALSRGTTLASQCIAATAPKARGMRTRNSSAAGTTQFQKTQMALFGGDKRKLDDADQDKIKKAMFKGLDSADFEVLAAYYATLK